MFPNPKKVVFKKYQVVRGSVPAPASNPLELFWPILHRTFALANVLCARNDFEKFLLFWPKKHPKTKFILEQKWLQRFVSKIVVEVLCNWPISQKLAHHLFYVKSIVFCKLLSLASKQPTLIWPNLHTHICGWLCAKKIVVTNFPKKLLFNVYK